MRNHRAWIVKCTFIRILELVLGLYPTCFKFMVYITPISNKIGCYQYGADGFKNLSSKTIVSSIQSIFEISSYDLSLLLFSRLALLLLYYLLFRPSTLDPVARHSWSRSLQQSTSC